MKKMHYMRKLRMDMRIIPGVTLPSPFCSTFVTKIASEVESYLICINISNEMQLYLGFYFNKPYVSGIHLAHHQK
jgi:hypothetical protein